MRFPVSFSALFAGTCGKADIVGYGIFTIFLCISNFILLNLVMAVLMRELQVSLSLPPSLPPSLSLSLSRARALSLSLSHSLCLPHFAPLSASFSPLSLPKMTQKRNPTTRTYRVLIVCRATPHASLRVQPHACTNTNSPTNSPTNTSQHTQAHLYTP